MGFGGNAARCLRFARRHRHEQPERTVDAPPPGLSVSLHRGLSKTYFQKHAASEPAAEGGDVVHLFPMKQTHSDGQLTYMLNRDEKSRAIDIVHI